jgi:hypothetical protein
MPPPPTADRCAESLFARPFAVGSTMCVLVCGPQARPGRNAPSKWGYGDVAEALAVGAVMNIHAYVPAPTDLLNSNFASFLKQGEACTTSCRAEHEEVCTALLCTHPRYGESGAAQLEMPRLVPYLSNGVFVLSERGVDAALEQALEGMVAFLPRGQTRVRALQDCSATNLALQVPRERSLGLCMRLPALPPRRR